MFEMTGDHVRANKSNFQRAVVLKARTLSKYVPILIGSASAEPIALKVQGQKLPRPMTHNLDVLDDTRLGREDNPGRGK